MSNLANFYELGLSIAAVTAGNPIAQLRNITGINPPDSSRVVGLLKVGIYNTTAVASSIGLVGANSIGTPTGGNEQSGNQVGGAGGSIDNGRLSTAWSVAPTANTKYFRRIVLPATIGAGIEWNWPEDDPLPIIRAAPLLLWNFGVGSTAALAFYMRWCDYIEL